MTAEWSLPEQLERFEWSVERVLLRYDHQAEIVLGRIEQKRCLAVAADEIEGATRWVAAPVSGTELDAIFSGACDVRTALLKENAFVVDLDESADHLIRGWRIDMLSVHSDYLPSRRATLDALVSRSSWAGADDVPVPQLRLDGPAVRENRVAFKVISALFDAKQRLWNALIQAVSGTTTARGAVTNMLQQLATLELSASPAPGSVVLQFSAADQDTFSKVVDRLVALVHASDSPIELNELLSQMGPRARSAYANYLQQIQKSAVEVFTRWPGGGVFVSPSAASRYSHVLQSVEAFESDTITVEGALVLYNSKTGNFEFKTADDEVTYSGHVAREVQAKYPALLVSQSDLYTVGIEVQRMSAVGAVQIQNCVLREILTMPTLEAGAAAPV